MRCSFIIPLLAILGGCNTHHVQPYIRTGGGMPGGIEGWHAGARVPFVLDEKNGLSLDHPSEHKPGEPINPREALFNPDGSRKQPVSPRDPNNLAQYGGNPAPPTAIGPRPAIAGPGRHK